MSEKKYIVYPGEVISQSDGDKHWIGARQLMILYGVHPNECLDASALHPAHNIYGLIPLRPRSDGKYAPRP